MPTYDYRCNDCGHEFEYMQKMTDDPLQNCPECTGNLKRLIGTGAGIIFKGSGFYQTDYRSEGYKKAAAKDSPSSSSDSSSQKDSTTKTTSESTSTTSSSKSATD